MPLTTMYRHHRDMGDSSFEDVGALNTGEAMNMEGVVGSVTSFVRKLFQMVQDECDSVVGFVADGTAFEVKDPRRLEQDILPKYFRHSRFQSLVRQLNFYSFKKISKERSVWIYKHAFFRRDEPELLHALKRKTNQHGGRVGANGEEDDGDIERPFRILHARRERHDLKPKPQGSMVAHHLCSSAFARDSSGESLQNGVRRPSRFPGFDSGDSTSLTRGHGRFSAAQNEVKPIARTGGGSSSDGVGGGVVPCYHRESSPSAGSSSNAGSGGRPVNAQGKSADDALRYDYGPPRHVTARASSTRAYRQGPAMGDRSVDTEGTGIVGGKRTLKHVPDSSGNPSDREEALALWGLSTLCQVASASTQSPRVNYDNRSPSHDNISRESRLIGRTRASEASCDVRKRPCTEGSSTGSWRCLRSEGASDTDDELDETNTNQDVREEEDEEGVTSGDDDSAASLQFNDISSFNAMGKHPYISRRHAESSSKSSRDRCYESSSGSRDYEHRYAANERTFTPTWAWGRPKPRLVTHASSFMHRLRAYDERMNSTDYEADAQGEHVYDSLQDERSKRHDRRAAANDTKSVAKGDEDESEEEEGEDEEERGSTSLEEDTDVCPRMVDDDERISAKIQTSRHLESDINAEISADLEGIGTLLLLANSSHTSKSVSAGQLGNVRDGLREVAVFCGGTAGKSPAAATKSALADQVSAFLGDEKAIAQDLRVYAEALDPTAAALIDDCASAPERQSDVYNTNLLRIFTRYAACRLGQASEVAAAMADESTAFHTRNGRDGDDERKQAAAHHLRSRLDQCRREWWAAAVRFT